MLLSFTQNILANINMMKRRSYSVHWITATRNINVTCQLVTTTAQPSLRRETGGLGTSLEYANTS